MQIEAKQDQKPNENDEPAKDEPVKAAENDEKITQKEQPVEEPKS